MDPASILGIISAAGAITSCIVRTLKDLNDLKAKYNAADLSIRLLKAELTAIKTALDGIHTYTEYNLEGDQTFNLGEGLEATLDGCELAMDVLAEDVASWLEKSSRDTGESSSLGIRDKTKLIWHEDTIRDHQDRLSRQTAALNLLLNAIQCNNLAEQTKLLRAPENRQKIQNVVDDASTIRVAKSQKASTVSSSRTSDGRSLGSIKAFEAELLDTDAYQHAMRHGRSVSDSARTPLIRQPQLSLQVPNQTPSDEGYETMSKTTSESTSSANYLSPTWSQGSLPRPLRPFETSALRASDAGKLHKIKTEHLPRSHSNRVHRLPYSPVQSPTVKLLDRKKSFWQSIRRKSDSALEESGKQQQAKSPIPGSRRGRRGAENAFHSSIDLSSTDVKSCPRIVRAAQLGSTDDLESLLEAGADKDARHRSTRRNAMAVAAHCGREDIVELLLRHDASISQRDYLQYTPLHLAASRGHTGVLRLLLSEDADIEARASSGQTALRLSCDGGHYEASELLLAHGAKVNARDDAHLTSLHAAAQRGDAHAVELLIRNGAHVSARDAKFMDGLHYACDNGHNSVVELLLSRKADIETIGTEGKTPLITAASAGHTHTVELLLKRKASLKSRGSGEMNALHWSAFNGHVETTDLLIQKKAPIHAVNIDGRTALHLAVMAEHFPVVELLLREHSALEGQCKAGFKPLHYACGSANADIAQLLLHSGANIEAITTAQDRPLHVATSEGRLSVVEMLLENGAHVDVRNTAGDRALLLACGKGDVEVVKALLDKGAAIRSKFGFGPSHEDSPLCTAAKNGHPDIVDLLLSRGASVRDKDEHDWVALRYGAYYGHPEVVERLLAGGASLSNIQTWGFNLTASSIGFAQNVHIPEDRKEHVTILLRNAEERERMEGDRIQEQRRHQFAARHQDSGVFDEISPPQLSELRPSTTRAGSKNLARRFSFEQPTQTQNDPSEDRGSEHSEPSSSNMTIDLGPRPRFKSNNPFRTQTPPSESGFTSESDSTIPTRTASEHVPNKYKDVTKRWQKVSALPTRSATVASNNTMTPSQSQQARPSPMSTLREVVSPLSSRTTSTATPSIVSPTPIPARSYQAYYPPTESIASYQTYRTESELDSKPYTTTTESLSSNSMPYSPESIIQTPASPPPPQRPPPPPPVPPEYRAEYGGVGYRDRWASSPAGVYEMG